MQQKKEVSDMLSVLPREMEEIRASKSKMLAREEMFEKKGSPVPLQLMLRGLSRNLRLGGMLRKSIRKILRSQIRRGMLNKILSLKWNLVLL